MLLAYCEECGRQYRFNPDKIPGRAARVKCRTCDHVFTVDKEPVAQALPQDTHLFGTVAQSAEKDEPALVEVRTAKRRATHRPWR